MTESLLDLTALQLALIVVFTIVASIIGGIAGYTGALMPLVLVPITGPEPVVPTIAIFALLTNASRAIAFRRAVDWRRATIVLAASAPTCLLGAWVYTLLNGRAILGIIGTMMITSVVLRRAIRGSAYRLGDGTLAAVSFGWGGLMGGTTGAGIILISALMAAGLQGAAVIATDAAVSMALGLVKAATFGVAGVVDAKVLAIALLMGVLAFPGAFIAKYLVERLSVRMHTTILDVVVVLGGGMMLARAVAG